MRRSPLAGLRSRVAPFVPRQRPEGLWSAALAVVLVGAVAAGALAIATWPNDRLPPATEAAALALDATDAASAPSQAPSLSASPTASPTDFPPSPELHSPEPSSGGPFSQEPSPSQSPRPSATPAPSSSGTGTDAGPGEGLARPPSDSLRLKRAATISGGLSPKSVVSSQTGYFLAQNMMYRHTVTVYDRDFQLVRTIRDRVNLARFGQAPERTIVQGAPVEAAFTPDGAAAYISQYSMYGPGYDRPGADTCHPDEERDPSFVYRIDMSTLSIDQVLPVGATPKYLAVSPDGRFLLVANWCSYSLSVFDIATSEEIRRLPIGPYPRGMTFTPDSSVAYIAVMGSD
nr:YncE family protein [Chloroflexota bacterium]